MYFMGNPSVRRRKFMATHKKDLMRFGRLASERFGTVDGNRTAKAEVMKDGAVRRRVGSTVPRRRVLRGPIPGSAADDALVVTGTRLGAAAGTLRIHARAIFAARLP